MMLTSIITVAACVQAIFAGLQWSIYRAQNRAFERLERPWLLVTWVTNAAQIEIKVKNVGRTPAQITSIEENSKVQDIDQELPMKFPFNNERLVHAHQEWIAQGDEPTVAVTFNLPTMAERLYDKTPQAHPTPSHTWYYGVIRYKGTTGDKPYESRFCYRWGGENGLIMGGPSGYNDKV